jgi:quercetin dioxygenase-like cupin family protein
MIPGGLLVIALGIASLPALAQLEPPCVENSPERRGEVGCTLVENKPLPVSLKDPLFWHIDRFDSADRARAAVTPVSVALEAHGSWWLLSIEPTTSDHHGGTHVNQVALSPLPAARKYSLLVFSAYIPAGLTSRVHLHSGVEAFYVVDGQQCLATETGAYPMKKNDILVLPTGVTMQLIATGPQPRRALAILVYDASQPPTTRMEAGPRLAPCPNSQP